MKILIAEDEPIMIMALETSLKKEGYTVLTTQDGREALTQIEQFKPDLLITDIMMPFTSGLELLGIIKSNPELKLPVIVISAIGQESIVLEAFKIGADDFLTKPFNHLELITRVKRLLHNDQKDS
jgi:DNA-binding response OmpR family regulator